MNAELEPDSSPIVAELATVAAHVRSPFGISIDRLDDLLFEALIEHAEGQLGWVVADAHVVSGEADRLAMLRSRGVAVLARTTRAPGDEPLPVEFVDGVVLKGHEAGGFVGESSTFVLVQQWLAQRDPDAPLPLYVHGGVTPEVAASCAAVGVAGGVLDSQLLLLRDIPLAAAVTRQLETLSGSETVAVGNAQHGEYFRILVRPGLTAARAFATDAQWHRDHELRAAAVGAVDWDDPSAGLLPVGQDIGFAESWRRRFRSLSGALQAIEKAVLEHPRIAADARAIATDAPLAQALGTRLPIVQGPMTRVSDRAEFADAVSRAGALPMVALALVRGEALETLLSETAAALGDRPWGVGLLGFAPKELLDEQLACALRADPDYAIIAGGRPDQAVELEAAGIPSFLHVPAAPLVEPFVRGGARRFIFEGRECGGHVGPLSSFVLWSAMVTALCDQLSRTQVPAAEFQVLFAGGIHDAWSSAMVQVLAAPLLARGVRVGILMGSAYLFTRQIVDSGAIVPRFQSEVLECSRTVTLTTGPGHASRCARSPFTDEFFRTRQSLDDEGLPADESRRVLDQLILGRLRVASKGTERTGPDHALQSLDEAAQHDRGMYMLGQVATLRSQLTDIDALHEEVSDGALARLDDHLRAQGETARSEDTAPLDIAIVGIGCSFPGSNTTEEYWDNILQEVDAITEIPRHRWDWRLYFSEDRKAKDKVYSKWGGFLDDLVFDPTRYGMPPRSVSAVDPMQLIALEVAKRTLADAGCDQSAYDHSRTSIIIGASGGTGDVGTQYCLRSELPRFVGELPPDIADRLPEWTEDSFAGILSNVIAGRIANRLNFGGINCTVDAACASSLASVYQAAHELVDGRADMVIAGGVDTVQGPFGYLCFSQTQALSPRGRCSTFDVDGDGIVISEGVAMVALKRLADAERDGDRIYAVIKGVGGSSDGRARGMTAPAPAGQLQAMRRAYQRAGFGPRTVGLFEAHGTGTVAGDVAELKSTTTLVRDSGGQPRQSAIGSVKTLIGHTKSTAGMAGLIKVAMALHRRVLPSHAGVSEPNPVLTREGCPLHLLSEPRPWLKQDTPRRGAVSAFGFGGTNFHVVLQEAAPDYRPWLAPSPAMRWPAELLLWGAADTDRLRAQIEGLRTELEGGAQFELRDLAATLAGRFTPDDETLALVARDIDTLASTLEAAVAHLDGRVETLPSGVHRGSRAGQRGPGGVAVLFAGQGAQHIDMLRELLVYFPVCAETLAGADEILRPAFEARFGEGRVPSRYVFPRGCYTADERQQAARALTSTDVAQPALGAVDAAAYHLLRSLGLRPDFFGGHSFGEFVALYAGGAMDFASMLTLAAARGRAIVDATESRGLELGTMAAVHAGRERVQALIDEVDDVVIANHNSPRQVVLSGTKQALGEATQRLVTDGIQVTALPVAAAFHSPQIEPASGPLAEAIAATPWRPTETPVYSNTTAAPHSSDASEIGAVMARHLVSPVEFVEQINAMYDDGARTFIELGPKSIQSRLVGRILADRPHTAVSIDASPGVGGLLDMLAQLVCAGVELDLQPLFANRAQPLADPLRLPRAPAVPKHAWLINGSGARPAGTPVQQIGVTVEQAQQSKRAPTTQPAHAAPTQPPRPATTASTAVARVPSVASRPRADVVPVPLPPRAPAMTQPNQSTMDGYFSMMRQFLETQERVMSAYVRASSRAPDEPLHLPAARVLPGPAAYAAIAGAAEAATIPPPPRVAPEPVPAPTPAANVSVPSPPEASASAAAAPVEGPAANAAPSYLDRNTLTNLLLGVVEDKTGYPRDLVSLTQNLEADLGIDSIKRVEVASAIVEKLPQEHRVALKPNLGELNTQSTLDGMLGVLERVNGHAKGDSTKEVAAPFDSSEAGAAVELDHPLRYTVVAHERPVPHDAARRLESGTFIVTQDRQGVALALIERLQGCGAAALAVPPDAMLDDKALSQWCRSQSFAAGSVAGIVHLAPIGADPIDPQGTVDQWRAQLWQQEKVLFSLLRDLAPALAPRAHVLGASSLGGTFGRGAQRSADATLLLQGGAPGLLKSQREERPDLRVRAVDVDPTRSAYEIGEQLFGELTLVGGRIEVGYPQGRRTTMHTVAMAMDSNREAPTFATTGVVLATGGARGVTAEVLRGLAAPGTTLVLTGRRPRPDAEAPEVAAAASQAELQALFIEHARRDGERPAPAAIGRRVRATLAARELRDNLRDFEQRGAVVEYHAVDVTDERSLRALVADIQQRHGAISGVLHGAGVIEDKRIVDKTDESWSRVVETKIMGLLLLHKLVPLGSLNFLAVMSSVAGRYGNSGQADYATANELMNRVCAQLQQHAGAGLNVMALCWGPWGATRFGQGMVNASTEAKFAAKGVALVSAESGQRLFFEELTLGSSDTVEVILGAGPWEQQEAEVGAIERTSPTTLAGPLLGSGARAVPGTVGRRYTVDIDPAAPYLDAHRIDGTAVLPAAAAVELLVEACAARWPGLQVTEMRDCRMLKGVTLPNPSTLIIELDARPASEDGRLQVQASLCSSAGPDAALRVHYRGFVHMASEREEGPVLVSPLHDERQLDVRTVYDDWLFHGPCLHMIDHIEGVSSSGASATVRAGAPGQWVGPSATEHPWVLDPALLDAAPQMAIIWSRAFRNETALPSRFGRVVRYRGDVSARTRMVFECLPADGPAQVRANVHFVDDRDRVVLSIEDLHSVSSASLNRLAGRRRAQSELRVRPQ
ncbi:MAG: SDR family NAD(P)-dependent oxidoreductase [Myxococcota bacterium]